MNAGRVPAVTRVLAISALAQSAHAQPEALVVAGDSYADAGTFGRRVTVQSEGAMVFTEHVAAALGVSICNAYAARGRTGPEAVSHSHCTSHAVAGARINHLTSGDSGLSVV